MHDPLERARPEVRMNGSRKMGYAMMAAMLAVTWGMPLSAQAPTTGYGPYAPAGGHYHEGEIGEMLLVLEHNLKCNCGTCGLDVHSCQFQMQCDVSPAWTQRIMASLQAGETPEAIEASFVADYGGAVLMSPPVEGFNLVGYFLPAVAIITAGLLIGFLTRRGSGGGGPAPVALADADAARLREELRRLDESEGPDW
jgi:cytochrome c-type biogenesis protein CcmH/NrfF